MRTSAAKKQRHAFFAVRRKFQRNSRRKADVGNPRTVVSRKIRVRKRKHAFGAREDFVSGQRAGVGDFFQNPAAAIKRGFPLPRAAGKQHVVFFCARSGDQKLAKRQMRLFGKRILHGRLKIQKQMSAQRCVRPVLHGDSPQFHRAFAAHGHHRFGAKRVVLCRIHRRIFRKHGFIVRAGASV